MKPDLASCRRKAHLRGMAKRTKPAVPMAMMTELGVTSWETILRRTAMIARGTCAPAEYQRMVVEKIAAAQKSAAVLARGGSASAALAPFLKRTKANVRRLRRSR